MGIDYVVAKLFGDTARTTGPVVALLIVVCLGLACLVLYFFKKKIDREDERERMELASRERERQALISQMSAKDARMDQLVNNHLEHDRQEREALSKVFTDISVKEQATTDALLAIASDIRKMAEKQDEMHKDMLREKL